MGAPILITGVGQRVGLALAKHLLEKGHRVIGSYRTERAVLDELREQGAELIQVDFYQPGAVSEFVEQVLALAPQLRAVIHNASDWLPESAELAPQEIMDKMMGIHVQVPYQLNLALREALESNPQPADIIHFTDYVVATGSKKHIAYAASKAALENLTLSFSSLLAPKVKVNSIAPALLLFNEGDDEAYKQKARSKSLLQREGGLEEALNSVDYLLNSGFVTGRCLHLDGGRHLK